MSVLPADTLEPPRRLCELAPPFETALLEWLRHKISRLMIEEISANDRDEDCARHFQGIATQLYRPEPPLGLISWHPREVLELQRWHEPDRAYVDHPPSGQRGHTKRLMACTILLRNVGHIDHIQRHSEEEFFVDTSAATLLRLTESALAIGGELPRLAIQFLLWLYQVQPYHIIRAFTAFSILLLVVNELGAGREPFQDLNATELCEWCIAVEKQSRAALGYRVSSELWLIGLSSQEDNKRDREEWRKLAGAVLHGTARDHLGAIQTIVPRFAGPATKQ
jgi:hypothetical protein